MKIACWSGPRNISTALMRSWSSRDDTFVSDEPFYAYYLKKTGLKHPMYKEIINYYPNDYETVIDSINKSIPKSKKIWYQKHMAHHLIDMKRIEWIKDFHNVFLIRHPQNVINSYVKKNDLKNIDELGYPQQWKLIEYLRKNEKDVIVIDSSILLKNPKKILSDLCKNLNIEFHEIMLQWDKGPYTTDGIWWKHWYNNVINTTTFQSTQYRNEKLPIKYYSIYKEAMQYYRQLSKNVLK